VENSVSKLGVNVLSDILQWCSVINKGIEFTLKEILRYCDVDAKKFFYR
jgi:hypothetical protein